MIKWLVALLFFITISSLVYFMVSSIATENNNSREKLLNIENDPRLKKTLSHLTPEEIDKLILKFDNEQSYLDRLKTISIVTIFVSVFLLSILFFKRPFLIRKFDGVALLVTAVLLVCVLFGLSIAINSQFENGHNATMQIRMLTAPVLLVFFPLLCYASYKLNRIEMKKKFHQKKWIYIFSIILLIGSGLVAVIIGIGILLTPDLSGNIS